MVTQIIDTSAHQQTHFFPKNTPVASRLGPIEKKNLSLQALARTKPLSYLAQNYGVSRKFLYQQAAKASDALDDVFMPSADDQKVLFYLPVTKNRIRQFVLALILICHSSFRGVIEILEDVFDYHNLSLGTIHNIVSKTVQKAQQINNAQDLSNIRVGVPDEIFQASKPVLVGMDARTTYCYLLAEDIRTLTDWMQNDILSPAGPDLQSRRELYDFVVGQLRGRENLCLHRIGPVRHMLENHCDNLLAFVSVLDERFAEISARFNVPLFLVHAICELQNLDENLPRYWQQQARLRKKLRDKFDRIKTAVRETLAETPRASSIVENLNSRLRNYFFLRRHIGNDYLHLLRFFLNHSRFQRSDRSERIGKSPAELLNAQTHPHWLGLLGFERFSRN